MDIMPPGIWCTSTPVSIIDILVRFRKFRYLGAIDSKCSPSLSMRFRSRPGSRGVPRSVASSGSRAGSEERRAKGARAVSIASTPASVALRYDIAPMPLVKWV